MKRTIEVGKTLGGYKEAGHMSQRRHEAEAGSGPRDAAKMVRTTIHRVSVGVSRIKLHLVFAL